MKKAATAALLLFSLGTAEAASTLNPLGVRSPGAFTYDHSVTPPCDIGSTIFCWGMAVLKSGYSGNALDYIKVSDGGTGSIGYASGVFNAAGWTSACAPTATVPNKCRVTKAYDQGASANHATAAETWLATSALNVAGAALNFASTSGLSVGMPADVNSAHCLATRIPPVSVDAGGLTATTAKLYTYDAAQPCATANGTGVLFGSGPTVSVNTNLIGLVASLLFDLSSDSRKTVAFRQALVLPSGVTFASNDYTLMATYRTNTCQGVGVFTLNAASSNAAALRFARGVTNFHHVNSGNSWVDSFTASKINKVCGPTQHFLMLQSNSSGVTLEIDGEVLFSNASTRNNTLTGGFIGASTGTGVEELSGGIEFTSFVIWTPALSDADAITAKASLKYYVKYPANYEDIQFHIGVDDRGQGSVTEYLHDYPRYLAEAFPQARVSSMAATTPLGVAATVCAQSNDTNYPTYVTAFKNTNAKKNVVVIAESPNDYAIPSTDPAVQEACLLALWSKLHADSFDVILQLLYPISSAFDNTQQAYNQAVSDWVVANAPSYVTVLDLRKDPFFNYDFGADQTCTQSGHDYLNRCASEVAMKIIQTITPLIQ